VSALDEVINVHDQHYILATSARADERTRVLKHGETFAVFDRFGDLRNLGVGEYGLYHQGTRHLSRFELRLGIKRPLLLSSTIQKANALLTVDLTNPDVANDREVVLPKGVLHLHRTKFLWAGAYYERILASNYGLSTITTSLTILFDADFVDVFEVRGAARPRKGQRLDPILSGAGVTLGYRGLDGIVRRTIISCEPPPREVTASTMTLDFHIPANESSRFSLAITCDGADDRALPSTYDVAFKHASEANRVAAEHQCQIRSSNHQFDEWVGRSIADLNMMITDTSHGRFPYAGIPWYSTPFGRDGIVAALQMLWLDPGVARGVLAFLAATQAIEVNDAIDAQPGKILHEARQGEMARLGEVPFARYYGSVDATPLFVTLAGAYYRRTGDRAFIQGLWPHVERALTWIDEFGDVDHDGFVEYLRRSPNGLVHQGWKDSGDAVFHADGSLAEGPIALCEVQGYVYAARVEAAGLAKMLGLDERARQLTEQAQSIQAQFEKTFWCDELGTYALALDGEKRLCKVVTSNPGHCLFSGIVSPGRALVLANTLFKDPSYSGWGIRTVAAGQRRYNPMSYHDGSVWPHDNAMIALGLSRYGFRSRVCDLFTGLFDSTLYLDLKRLPELFCGFSRRSGEGPTLYPIACLPQAWAAGAVFMFLQATLGLTIDGVKGELTLARPLMPEWLPRLELENVKVGQGSVDLLCDRHTHDVGISVLRRHGNVTVVHVA
jgi:glycogen debranching enzyme